MKVNVKESLRLSKRPVMRLVCCTVAVAGLLSFYSCDKVAESTKLNVPVEKATIELGDIPVENGAAPLNGMYTSETLNHFNVSRVITLEDIEGLTQDALSHQSQISDIDIADASITIVANDDETGTVVKDFVLKADGVPNTLSIPHYELGTVFAENVQPFAAAMVLKMLMTNSVSIEVSGKTDVTSGKNLQAKIELKDITLMVGLN